MNMRKYMTKEVTKTTVKVAKMEVQNGMPVAVPLEDIVLMGNVSMEKAQKEVNKNSDGVTVFEVQADTQVYRMKVEEFIKVAELVTKDTEQEDEDEDEEEQA